MITRASVFTWTSQKGGGYWSRGQGVGTNNSLMNQLEWFSSETGISKYDQKKLTPHLMDVGKGMLLLIARLTS